MSYESRIIMNDSLVVSIGSDYYKNLYAMHRPYKLKIQLILNDNFKQQK